MAPTWLSAFVRKKAFSHTVVVVFLLLWLFVVSNDASNSRSIESGGEARLNWTDYAGETTSLSTVRKNQSKAVAQIFSDFWETVNRLTISEEAYVEASLFAKQTMSNVSSDATTISTDEANDHRTSRSHQGDHEDKGTAVLKENANIAPALAPIEESPAGVSEGASLAEVQESRRLDFIDRMSWISELWMRKETTASTSKLHGQNSSNLEAIAAESDLALPNRHFHVVTTASLPWFTGTAVNPLLRAAYLHRRTRQINGADSKTRWVTLVIPWLELEQDQQDLYGRVFESCREQELYIREWLRHEAELPDAACPKSGLKVLFYPSRYHTGLRSIFAMGDLLQTIERDGSPMDVCVLEEPEHVNWFRAPGDGWTQKFKFVVGVVHTNYKEYANAHYSGLWTAPAISMISAAMVRAYCHKVIKLSAVLQVYAPDKEVVSNVHGVRSDFLREGERRSGKAQEITTGVETGESPEVYFIGKLLWAKGLDIMLDLEDYHKQITGSFFPVDIFGSGPDQEAIRRAFHGRRRTRTEKDKKENKRPRQLFLLENYLEILRGGKRDLGALDGDDNTPPSDGSKFPFTPQEPDTKPVGEDEEPSFRVKAKERLAKFKDDIPQTFSELRREPVPANFPGRVDHVTLKRHKIFVNPSISEVLCTTTAEALAMGKFAILPVHPSNEFFVKFPNCLMYRNKFEFVANLRWAMNHEPEPLTSELLRHFTWEAATDRFFDASMMTIGEAQQRERLGRSKLDDRIAWFHNELGKGPTGDILRKLFGAGPVSDQSKYLKEQESGKDKEDDGYCDGEEDEDDGLPAKFRRSSFAEALRATVSDLSSFLQ